MFAILSVPFPVAFDEEKSTVRKMQVPAQCPIFLSLGIIKSWKDSIDT